MIQVDHPPPPAPPLVMMTNHQRRGTASITWLALVPEGMTVQSYMGQPLLIMKTWKPWYVN